MSKEKKDLSYKKKFHKTKKKRPPRKNPLMKRNSGLTPLVGIQNRLKKAPEGAQKVVLLSTGSYDPPHYGHIDVFKLAKDHLEKDKKFFVVSAYVSPSHDHWLEMKWKKRGSKSFAKDDQRCEIAKKLIKARKYDDWLFLDKAECKHDKFIGHTAVLVSLKDYLDEQFPKEEIRCMYVCGYDLFVRCHGHKDLHRDDYGLVVVTRKETEQLKGEHYKIVDKQIQKLKNENLFFFENTNKDTYSLSSTLLRDLFVDNKEVAETMMPKEAVAYIRKQKIYKKDEKKDDKKKK